VTIYAPPLPRHQKYRGGKTLCLSVCVMTLGQKRCNLGIRLPWNTSRKPMLNVKPTGQGGLMTTESGRNDLDLGIVNVSITNTERWLGLLLSTNGKSYTCRLPIIYRNHWYRVITGSDRTRLFIFSAHLSTVNCHRLGWGISCRRWAKQFVCF